MLPRSISQLPRGKGLSVKKLSPPLFDPKRGFFVDTLALASLCIVHELTTMPSAFNDLWESTIFSRQSISLVHSMPLFCRLRCICHGRRLRQCGVTLPQYIISMRNPRRRFRKKEEEDKGGVQITLPFRRLVREAKDLD